MFIILSLIIAVAAFNLVSTLVMVVTDKQPDIAILRTLGASPGTIMKIFMVQGALIGVIGTLLGVAAGVLLALNIDVVVPFIERMFGFQFLSPRSTTSASCPRTCTGATCRSIGAGLARARRSSRRSIPSWRASRVNPAEALRYE